MPQAHCLVKTSGYSAEVIKPTNNIGFQESGKYHLKHYNLLTIICYVNQWQITDLKAKHILKNSTPYMYFCVFVCVCVYMYIIKIERIQKPSN